MRPLRARSLSVALLLIAASSCAAPRLERYAFEAPAMGTLFRVVLFAPDAERAERAAHAALARVAELERALSDFDPDSELSRLARRSDAGAPSEPIALSPELFAVLLEAQRVARRSDGAFDVSVGPYVRLWRRAGRQGELPSAERLAEAARAVGFEKLELDPLDRSARLHARGMRLDLGGIAKGFALDEALATLCAHGIERALVDGGGDLVLGLPPPGRAGWRIALARLPGEAEVTRLCLASAAIATSGDLERFVELDGVRYSHLIDPRTGAAVAERRLVSVVAHSGMQADALASALSVLGAEAGLALAAREPGVEARVVTLADGALVCAATPRFGALAVP